MVHNSFPVLHPARKSCCAEKSGKTFKGVVLCLCGSKVVGLSSRLNVETQSKKRLADRAGARKQEQTDECAVIAKLSFSKLKHGKVCSKHNHQNKKINLHHRLKQHQSCQCISEEQTCGLSFNTRAT